MWFDNVEWDLYVRSVRLEYPLHEIRKVVMPIVFEQMQLFLEDNQILNVVLLKIMRLLQYIHEVNLIG